MKKRMDSIQALRFLACLGVFINHCYYDKDITGGCLSVALMTLFFVLSGFLMAYNYHSRPALSLNPLSAARFTVKKIWKLYPLHVLTMLPILALTIYARSVTGTSMKFILTSVLENLLLIQAWSCDYALTLNGVAWYLSVCVFLYFMFPYIFSCIHAYRSRRTAYFAIVALYAAQLAFAALAQPVWRAFYAEKELAKFLSWYSYALPLLRVFDFAIGCNLGYLFVTRRDGEHENRRRSIIAEVLCVVLFTLTTYIVKYSGSVFSRVEFSSAVIYMPYAAAIVYVFADGGGIIPKLFTNRVTVFLGNISSYFFLIHQDVIRPSYMLLDRFGLTMEQSRPILFVGCGIISVVLSVLYEKLEKSVKRKALQA